MSKSLREQTIDFGNTAEWDQCLDTFCFSQSCENADHVNNCVWEMDFANSVPTSPGILLRWGVGCRSIVQLFSGQSSTSCQYLKACFSRSSWVCWESCCSNLSAYSTNLFFHFLWFSIHSLTTPLLSVSSLFPLSGTSHLLCINLTTPDLRYLSTINSPSWISCGLFPGWILDFFHGGIFTDSFV